MLADVEDETTSDRQDGRAKPNSLLLLPPFAGLQMPQMQELHVIRFWQIDKQFNHYSSLVEVEEKFGIQRWNTRGEWAVS